MPLFQFAGDDDAAAGGSREREQSQTCDLHNRIQYRKQALIGKHNLGGLARFRGSELEGFGVHVFRERAGSMGGWVVPKYGTRILASKVSDCVEANFKFQEARRARGRWIDTRR
jgi:hypothetical protein